MCPVLIAERSQFHSDESFERNDGELALAFGLRDVGSSLQIVGDDFFARKDNMDCFTGFGIGTIEKHFQAMLIGVIGHDFALVASREGLPSAQIDRIVGEVN